MEAALTAYLAFSEVNFSLSFNVFFFAIWCSVFSLFYFNKDWQWSINTGNSTSTWGKILFHFYILSSLCSHTQTTVYFDSTIPEKPGSCIHQVNKTRSEKLSIERPLQGEPSVFVDRQWSSTQTNNRLSIHRSRGTISELLTQFSPLELESMWCSPCTSDLSTNLLPFLISLLNCRLWFWRNKTQINLWGSKSHNQLLYFLIWNILYPM